ncbi:hypothetical protein CHU95_10735 [Niveispirillum lacus]|uniref:4-coumarate--CoA ligase n=1 Tax=Niveispirillum lacus TaxID=1981099 RepID=A0A255Z0M4_9PROT|nr:AMP-binding protein [Niveispirillum lacus]OYQ34494.1 hypothetical protein CHU95_10735 [Niveispirillum lacus]
MDMVEPFESDRDGQAGGKATVSGAVGPIWWRDGAALSRFIADLVASDLSRLRPGATIPPSGGWAPELEFGANGLGMDSLELVSIATSLTEVLHLHRSGIEDYLLARRRFGDWVQIVAKGLSIFDQEITFRTSGSTGTPKPCTHRVDGLLREVAVHARLFGACTRVISLVPGHHIYGFLFTILLPRMLGAAVVDARSRLPGRILSDLRPGDLLVAVPEQWALLARTGDYRLSDVSGVCSTGPLDPAVHQTLMTRGLILTEVYGSSETAGIGWRQSPEQPFRLFDGLSLNSDGTGLHAGWDGLEKELQDRLDRVDDCHFRLTGRRDGAVQIGGVNVFPERVVTALRAHPAVRDAAVRTMPVPGGLRLKAFIVPQDPDQIGLETTLQAWADTQLSMPERPKSWTFGPVLPTSALGKLCDW